MAALFRMERGIPYVRMENAGRMAVESLLMVTVGVLVGRLAWVALAPADAGAPLQDSATLSSESLQASGSASTTVLLTQMNPFGGAPQMYAADAQAAAETTLDLKLAGVRSVSGNASASSAVISFPDGAQKRFVPGEEVMPGILLVNVTSDAIHLSRNGSIESLSLYPYRTAPFVQDPAQSSPAEARVYASDTVAPVVDVTPAALAADTALTPEFRSGEVSGYRLEPRGAGAFEAAGLQSGDLILRINGQAIEGLRPDQINQSVSSSSDVALDIVRQGAIVRLRVAPGANLSQ